MRRSKKPCPDRARAADRTCAAGLRRQGARPLAGLHRGEGRAGHGRPLGGGQTTSSLRTASCATCSPPWMWPNAMARTRRARRPESQTRRRPAAQPGAGQSTSEEDAGSDAAPSEENESAEEQMDDGEMDGAEISDEEMSDEGEDDSETPGEVKRPAHPFDDFNEKVDYAVFTSEFDETIASEDLCDEAELDRLRGHPRQAAAHLQGAVGRLANRLQRRLMAQQNGPGIRPRRRLSRPGAPAAPGDRPHAAALLQGASATRISATLSSPF